jgi:hypothetical protein
MAKTAKSSPQNPVNSIREYRQAVIDFGRFASDVDQGKHPPLPLEELQQKKYALLKKVKEKHPGAVWAAVHHGKETLERITNLLGDLEHACYHHRFPEEGGLGPLSVILTLLPTLFTILDTLEQNIEKPTQINMDAENKDSEKAKVPVPPPRMILDRDTLTISHPRRSPTEQARPA